MNVISKDIVEQLVDGYWYIEPQEGWKTTHISESCYTCLGKETLFIAMDEDTWLRGTGNTGIYGKWNDTHNLISNYSKKINGVIAQRPILNLPKEIPQYIVNDSFEFINKYSEYIRERIDSIVISITGTVGKTSTKEYLKKLLSEFGSVYATNKNHNSRTGVKLTISNSMHSPDYVIVETAMAALWMRKGSISLFAKPDIAIVTEIGVGQKGYDESKTADFKSRIAQGMNPNGVIILNRDIKNYEELKKFCERYCKNILSYGRSLLADINFFLKENVLFVKYKKIEYKFNITQLDDGTLYNLAAAISVALYLGLDIRKHQELFRVIRKNKSILEELKCQNENIVIVDDTYNAEYLSMLNAFKYCNEKYKNRRKILVVGDIVNLGNKSREVHESLFSPIIENNFDLIATFGKDTIYLNNKLPKDKLIGHFSDINDCCQEVKKNCKSNDVILIKGSRRNSMIHNIPYLLKKYIEELKDLNEEKYWVVDFNNVNSNIGEKKLKYGIGGFLICYLALKEYTLKKIDLNTEYIVTDNVHREGLLKNSIGLKKGEVYTFYELFQQVKFFQKPDSILALSEMIYGSTGRAVKEMRKIAGEFGIESETVLNVTGRNFRNNEQSVNIASVIEIAKKIQKFPDRTQALLNVLYFKYNGNILKQSLVINTIDLSYKVFFIGHENRRYYIVIKDDRLIIIQSSNVNGEVNFLTPYLFKYGADFNVKAKTIFSKSSVINILGDTYFGEYYTRKRKIAGISDALQKYGYDHSFKNIKKFFNENDLNIVNFEASFFKSESSPLEMIKPFILGANAKESINELKNNNINHLVLANNHAKDYGEEGLDYTLENLDAVNISYIGAGRNLKESLQIYEVENGFNRVAIFNGYWFRETAYTEFNFYALPNKNGVNSLSILPYFIEEYRKNNPESKIIVIAHWGVDFKSVHKAQRTMSEKLIVSGADLIIGHGPHTLQPVEKYKGKIVFYSIGNGVFNSNGEFNKHKVPPFGLVVKINFEKSKIRLHPILTDNKKTFWQPTESTTKDIPEVMQALEFSNIETNIILGGDLTYCIELDF